MAKTILITGGAGFIGSHLADELIEAGYSVRALDNLHPQVHGAARARPAYLHDAVDLRVGDVRDPNAVREALEGVDAVVHFAAAVGVGQSMYQIAEYTDVNNRGTAVLLEALSANPVERLVVASSMSIYGEGLYRRGDGSRYEHAERTLDDLKRARWEPRSFNGSDLIPIPTDEEKEPNLSSVYALSKYDQERMCMIVGRAYRFPVVALRFFNVFGTRQALSNPYTGVLAIFASRLLNDRAPQIFEDGHQKRDFVSVKDVALACRLSLEKERAVGQVINVGSGKPVTVLEVARRMAMVLGKEHIEPEVAGRYRMGDIRHCFADIGRAREVLGYEPRVDLASGMEELAEWLKEQHADDLIDQARRELDSRGLTL